MSKKKFSDECTYGIDEFGLYANSREEYWSELNGRTDTYLKLTKLVEYVEIWDVKQQTWYSLFSYYYGINQTRLDQLFR